MQLVFGLQDFPRPFTSPSQILLFIIYQVILRTKTSLENYSVLPTDIDFHENQPDPLHHREKKK